MAGGAAGGSEWPHGWPYRAEYAAAKGKWPLRRDDNRERRRLLPDLALLQQPLDGVRSYFGAQIAFFFAWSESYSMWLLCTMWAGVLSFIVGAATGQHELVAPFYSLLLTLSVAVFNKLWLRRRSGLAHVWDVADFRQSERPRPEFLRAYRQHTFWKGADHGGRGRMRLRNGYYTTGGRFVADDAAQEVVGHPSP